MQSDSLSLLTFFLLHLKSYRFFTLIKDNQPSWVKEPLFIPLQQDE